MQWLVVSVVLSLVLTVVLNVALHAFPHAGERIGRGLADLVAPKLDEPPRDDRRVRVFIPWKAMIIGSVVLTILVNAARWIS